MTGDVPFREIQNGPALVLKVINEQPIPQVPELQDNTASPKANIIDNTLQQCWKHAERVVDRSGGCCVGEFDKMVESISSD
ncbi:hypothetical protein FRC09_001376 [Ceratobasidium sp. 395]|nr:hypothetical protein FRC09_001376 [Ceratobasidium sp. 395]